MSPAIIASLTCLGLLSIFIIVSASLLARSRKRRNPDWISSFGTWVWTNGFPVAREEFEQLQRTILEVFPNTRSSWTKEAIERSFRGLQVFFVPMPIRTPHGNASGTTDPERGEYVHVSFVIPLADCAFAHEFIHVLSIRVDGTPYEDDVAHRDWIARGYYEAIDRVRTKAHGS